MKKSLLGLVAGTALTLGATACSTSGTTGASGAGTTTLATSSTTSASAESGSQGTTAVTAVTGTTVATTAGLTTAVTKALQSESLALEAYQRIVTAFGGVSPFSGILTGEQQHVSTLEQVAQGHSIALPPGPSVAPNAPTTKTAACQLGVGLEQGLVDLYDNLLPQVTRYPDVTRAFTALRTVAQGSYLPALQRCV